MEVHVLPVSSAIGIGLLTLYDEPSLFMRFRSLLKA